MKIKTQVAFGVGLLFLLIILLAVVGAWYINTLKKDTNNILTSNYNSVQYSRNMLLALDDIPRNPKAIADFEINLKNQENNITEVGEKGATKQLADNLNEWLSHPYDTSAQKLIRRNILEVMHLNMQAIVRKSKVASETAETATIWIAITGTFCFIIAFVLLINLPGNIANPIKELTESTMQIADQNYTQRVHFKGRSEFGELAKSFNTMAEKLEEYAGSNLSKILIEKKRIEAIINNMHDPVIGLDEQNDILFINEEALKITGLVKEDVVGRSVKDVALTNDLIRSLIQDIFAVKKAEKKEQESPLKIYANGKESYFEKNILTISITPTGEESKQITGNVIMLRNITVYKELDAAKTNFIATVSHELKTPISSIQMSLQLLGQEAIGKLNDEQKALLESIGEDSTRLLKITGELLNMTQLESGNIQLSISTSDPVEILQYAINVNKTAADQKQIEMEAHYPDNLPEVRADSEKAAWVLTNLISNAIRYSYNNSTVFLGISVEKEHVAFTVKDTGQGISLEYKDKIFDRYFRIPGSKKEGTGLGLTISKEFIEAQGGHITVESSLDTGSIFTVTLPVAA
ncbi:MAG: HAMP domain-containing protein [Chitinophagaceae bacterium]|nr:MAG: HAMP domain-containing protein [Chitinophagaceae bacterium]